MFGNSKAFSSFSVDDLDRARQFYSATLGIEVTEEYGMLRLWIAGSTPILAYAKTNHVPATYTVLNFPVADIDAAVTTLNQRGVGFETYDDDMFKTDSRGIARGEFGPPIAWFKDPAGNILAVIEEVAK